MVEQIQGTFDIDLQRGRYMVGFLLFLFQKGVVEILQKRHVLRLRVIEIALIDLMDTAVNDRLFHRLQAFLAADNQLAQGKDKVRLQGDRIILLRIVRVDIHGVDILRAGRADLDDLAVKPVHQRGILCFRIGNDHVVIRH